MSPELMTVLLFGSMVVCLVLGVPLVFVLGGLAVVFTYFLWGPAALYNVATKTFSGMSAFILVATPMFIFMANMLEKSGVADDLYDAMHQWLGGLKGGLAIGTVLICVIFAAMAGVSGAATVSMGLIALPAMLRRKYDKSIAVGCIMGGGALGILIPPSVTMIFIALISQQSVGQLFMGGVFPGLILATLFIIYIAIRCRFQPHLGPPLPPEERSSWKEKSIALRGIVIPMLLVFLVLGTIFLGITTPTEAAAIGAIGSIISAALYRRLKWALFKEACYRTFVLTVMVTWIYYAALAFTALYAATGAADLVTELLTSVPGGRWGTIIAMQLIFLILGCFLDPTGIIMICLPLFGPIVVSLGFDLIWFGVLFVVNMEMAYLTPPFGFNLFYMRGVAPRDVTMGDIYRSVTPFVLLQAVGLALVMIFPNIVMWLPGLMIQRVT